MPTRSFISLLALVTLSIAGCAPPPNRDSAHKNNAHKNNANEIKRGPAASPPDNKAEATKDEPQATIPIWLNESGSVALSALLNDTEELRLMLHSGVDSASLTKTAAQRLSSVHWDSKDDVSTWGGDAEARVSSNNKLQIGPVTLRNVSLTEVEQAALGTDGKVGVHQLGYGLIEFDFTASVVHLFDTLPRGLQSYQALPLTIDRGLLFLTAELTIGERKLEHEFMIHTGFGGTLLLDDEFVRSQQLSLLLPELGHRELQDSYGNKIRTTQSSIDLLRIGDVAIPDVSVELFDSSLGRQKISVIGVEVLRQIDFVLDLDGNRILIPSIEDHPNDNLEATARILNPEG